MAGNVPLEVALGDANDDTSVFWADLGDDCMPLLVGALEGLDEALGEIAFLPPE